MDETSNTPAPESTEATPAPAETDDAISQALSDDGQDEAKQDSTEETKPAETQKSETAKESDTPATTEAEPEPTEEQTVENEQPDDVKKHNAEMAQRRIAEREARNQRLREAVDEVARQADPNELADQVEVLKAQNYLREVETNQNSLISEHEKATNDIPLFNPESDTYNPDLHAQLVEDFESQYVVADPQTGDVVGAYDRNGNKVSLYQYLKVQSDRFELATKQGALKGQQAATKMAARSEARGTAAPKTKEVDPIMQALSDD